jgi:hypothetical protein
LTISSSSDSSLSPPHRRRPRWPAKYGREVCRCTISCLGRSSPSSKSDLGLRGCLVVVLILAMVVGTKVIHDTQDLGSGLPLSGCAVFLVASRLQILEGLGEHRVSEVQ